jgi:DNA glycosylase AlkZ-like
MTPLDIARLRLANQQITAHTSKTPQEVVAALGAIQAQDYRSAIWAVGLRLSEASEADIERAVAGGAIVRTWAMRGTLHFLASADVRWILGLLAPRVMAGNAYRRRQLEIDDATLARSRDLFADALSHGRRLARAEAMNLLEGAGIKTTGQRGIHILGHLSLEGLLCQATVEGRQPTFALLDEWAPDAETMSLEDALAELACRYFSSHGPATLRDFVWWSGLTAADAKAGIELAKTRFAREQAGDTVYWMPAQSSASQQAARVVCLLPGFDEYILGYADREIALDAVASQRIVPGGNGVFRPTIVVDGRVVGTWRLVNKTRASPVIDLFSSLDAAASRSLTKALRDYESFARGPLHPPYQ